MEITEQHVELIKFVREHLGEWRKYTISIDGRDGVGKSTLSRLLAWQMEVPAIETDLLIEGNGDLHSFNKDVLKYLIEARHRKNRPVIVEGVLMLKRLKDIGVDADITIYVEDPNEPGSYTWKKLFDDYEAEYHPKERAHITFLRTDN